MGTFEFKPLELTGAYLIFNFSVGDSRGGFTKCYEKDIFAEAGIQFQLNESFVSVSEKNVIRGLHFQLRHPQAKIVCVVRGSIYDVIVDLRKDSPTYKKWIGYTLDSTNHAALFVPRGFAHGFLSKESDTTVLYQCDGRYYPDFDSGIRYDDPDIAIQWPIDDISKSIHSARDLQLSFFSQFEASDIGFSL